MTTTLEKQFFDTFGIEKKCTNKKLFVTCNLPGCEAYCKQCVIKYESYPEITDRRLLEMICIVGTVIRHFKIPPKLKLEQLKYHILRNCINEQDDIYIKIQQLFKEEE